MASRNPITMSQSLERTFARRLLAVAMAMLCVASSRGRGQLPTVKPGSDVRLRATSLTRVHDGVVVRSTAESLFVKLDIGGPPLGIPDRQMITLEVSHGRPGWQRRAVFGAAVGFGIALASFHSQQSGCLDGYCPGSKSDLKALVLAGSAGLGAIIAQIGLHERWESVLDRRPPTENLR